MTTFIQVTDGCEEFKRVPYIHYPVKFQESQEQVRALLDSSSKVNAMSPV